jgi:sugar phosphate isomerase/epimerase
MKTFVQQIMLGTVTGSESQARETLRKIKAAGYDGLELNRFMIHPSSLTVRLMTRAAGMPTGKGGNLNWHVLLAESGLSVASLHVDLGSLEREADAVAEEAKSYGTDKAVITGMYRFDYSDEAAVRELAQRLNKAGEVLKAGGIELLYHNHNVELLPAAPGLRAYEILLNETDPSVLNFEFDSYWFTDGGADAKLWMKKLGERMKLWHINDRGSRQTGPAMTPILKADSMELGTGSMDLEGLWEIAAFNGVKQVVLESHKNWIDKNPVKSLELSAKWLNARKD